MDRSELLELNEYQEAALATDQVSEGDSNAVVVPLLGIAGEAGSLLVAYKKRLRDGPGYTGFTDQIAEELGDILWYVANLGSKFGLRLEDIARANLAKTAERWERHAAGEAPRTEPLLFDEAFPEGEQFPREMVAELSQTIDDRGFAHVRLMVNGASVGDPLNDNARVEDGYRFHDVLHLANVAILGWSPTMRGLMRRKRKSNREVDDAEDGARAIAIDEGVVAMVFQHARRHAFFEGVTRVDYDLLRSIKQWTSGFEVAVRSLAEWEHAILEGYRVWRAIRAKGHGRIALHLVERKVQLLD